MCARQKSVAKHTEKKSDKADSELFHAPSSAKPIDGDYATAAQLFADTGMDDSALRRRAREVNPVTHAAWLPGPRGSKFSVLATLRGCLAWYRHQIETAAARTLPRQCANMSDIEGCFHIPVEVQKYLRKQGLCPLAFDASNRVLIIPLLEALQPFLKKLFSPGGAQIAGLAGFEQLDKDTMQARVSAQIEIEKIRDNALATKQLQTREGIENEIGIPLAAVAAKWKNYEKETGAKLKSLLAGAGVPPEIIKQAIHIATAGVQEPMEKLRAALPLTNELEKAA